MNQSAIDKFSHVRLNSIRNCLKLSYTRTMTLVLEDRIKNRESATLLVLSTYVQLLYCIPKFLVSIILYKAIYIFFVVKCHVADTAFTSFSLKYGMDFSCAHLINRHTFFVIVHFLLKVCLLMYI